MSFLPVAAYRAAVHLDEPTPGSARRASTPLETLCRAVATLLTVRPADADPLAPDVAAAADVLLDSRSAGAAPTPVASLPFVLGADGGDASPRAAALRRVAVWRGDITALGVDAIVNAANAALCGCFEPGHACIDNAIHAAAGPALRRDCATIMALQGLAEEPVGAAKVTRGYHLPARFVLHTVGPQVARGATPTPEQRAQLAACYAACLDCAAETGAITSIAFCCVSTGVFGFPQAAAAAIASNAVVQWLQAHPDGPVQRVVFNVLRADDEQHYLDCLVPSAAAPSAVPRGGGGGGGSCGASGGAVAAAELACAAAWLRDADCVLVAGGAGLSAAAGLDYTDTALFARLFPAMAARGFSCMYDFIGYAGWESEALRWGYLASQVELARYQWPLHAVYAQLREVAEGAPRAAGGPRDCFALTSNVDGMFERNGFDPARVFAPQGDYARMQCLRPCAPDAVWPMRPFLDAALPHIDRATMLVTEPRAVPRCPRCGGPVVMNVRGGDWFIESPTAPAAAAFDAWLRRATAPCRRLVVVEVGAGFNTPGVVRGRCEDAVRRSAGARLVRINAQHAAVPADLVGRAAQVFGDAAWAIGALHAALAT